MKTIEELRELYEMHGNSQYGGEAVTQREHALQCALLAEQEGASEALIAAALLHDIGHLLHNLPDDAPDRGVDDRHETSGGHHLMEMFPKSVTEPVRLHVAAKRYLCGADQDYAAALSEPSKVSLKLQGGPMDTEEMATFESNPWFEDAVRLRRWDDDAKVIDLETPSLDYYMGFVARCVSVKKN